MDAVADADFAARMSLHGGLAFINLEGLYTRYEDAGPIIERVAERPPTRRPPSSLPAHTPPRCAMT